MGIIKHLEWNKSDNNIYENFWPIADVIVRRKYIALIAYVKKKKSKKQDWNLFIYLTQEYRTRMVAEMQRHKRMEIVRTGAEINIEIKGKAPKVKSWLFAKGD